MSIIPRYPCWFRRLCPPVPRCGDSDRGIYLGEWMVPRCYGIDDSENSAYSSQKTSNCSCVFEAFEKTRSFAKRALSYFPCVGDPGWVTKLFRIEGENMRCGEAQIGGNSFRKIRYFVDCASLFFTSITQNRRNTTMFRKRIVVIFAKQRRRAYTIC